MRGTWDDVTRNATAIRIVSYPLPLEFLVLLLVSYEERERGPLDYGTR